MSKEKGIQVLVVGEANIITNGIFPAIIAAGTKEVFVVDNEKKTLNEIIEKSKSLPIVNHYPTEPVMLSRREIRELKRKKQ